MTVLNLANRQSIEELQPYLVASPKITPVMIRGRGAEVEDEDGNTYLDFEAGPGVLNVGHCHPTVVAAIKGQAEQLMQGSGRFHSRLTLELAQRLSRLTDERLKGVFFTNSGAEANDGALKLALKHATLRGKQGFGIIALEHGFHGRLSLPLAVTSNPELKKGFGPYLSTPGVIHIAPPYFYRCPFGSRTPEECGDRAAQALRDALKARVPGEAAVMIAEPILGLSGIIIPPDNYWPQIEEICAENKITLVMDEVFLGFGRTGKMFAHEHWGVKPSIITFAKAIGGGLPMGGFLASPELAAAFGPADHNTTFGSNNQVGIAAGHAVLDVLEQEHLPERAKFAGERLLDGFRRLQSKHSYIGDVRGIGMALAIEVVKNRDTKEPAAPLAKTLQKRLLDNGVLVGVSGVWGNVLRMSPPLTMTNDQIDRSLAGFERAFDIDE